MKLYIEKRGNLGYTFGAATANKDLIIWIWRKTCLAGVNTTREEDWECIDAMNTSKEAIINVQSGEREVCFKIGSRKQEDKR
jgi:hypothetical protein